MCRSLAPFYNSGVWKNKKERLHCRSYLLDVIKQVEAHSSSKQKHLKSHYRWSHGLSLYRAKINEPSQLVWFLLNFFFQKKIKSWNFLYVKFISSLSAERLLYNRRSVFYFPTDWILPFSRVRWSTQTTSRQNSFSSPGRLPTTADKMTTAFRSCLCCLSPSAIVRMSMSVQQLSGSDWKEKKQKT